MSNNTFIRRKEKTIERGEEEEKNCIIETTNGPLNIHPLFAKPPQKTAGYNSEIQYNITLEDG